MTQEVIDYLVDLQTSETYISARDKLRKYAEAENDKDAFATVDRIQKTISENAKKCQATYDSLSSDERADIDLICNLFNL